MPEQTPPPVLLDYQNPNMSSGLFWREGMTLVVTNGVLLPLRCVKCNCTETVSLKSKKFTWYPRWTLVLIVFNILVFAIVALVLQKKVTISYGLCAKHRRQHWMAITIAISAVLASIGLWILAAHMSSPGFGWAGALLFVADLFYLVIAVPVLRVQAIRDGKAWLKGACADYLTTLVAAGAPEPPLVIRRQDQQSS